MIRWAALLVIIPALAGCLETRVVPSPNDHEPLARSDAINFTADWRGDFFFRFTVEARPGTTCDLSYYMSGKSLDAAQVFHEILQSGDGTPLMFFSQTAAHSNVEPSIEVTAAGETLHTKERKAYEDWIVGDSRDIREIPPDGLIVTFAGRNLQPYSPTSDSTGLIVGAVEPQSGRTFHVGGDCSAPVQVHDLTLGREVFFFNNDDFDTSAKLFLTGAPSDVSVVAHGRLVRDMRSPLVQFLGVSGGDPEKAGTLTLRHPAGERSWTFEPTDVGTFLELSSVSGTYDFTLDWATPGIVSMEGILAETRSIDAFPG